MVVIKVLVAAFLLAMGELVDGGGQGNDALLTEWDATSGRIPILFTKTAAKECIDDGDYAKKLSWYVKRFHNDLWRPMWVEDGITWTFVYACTL